MLRLLTAVMLANLLTTLPASADAKGASSMTLSLTSPAFAEGGQIPTRYTCEVQAFRRRLPDRDLPPLRSLA
jgi:phosphatidylethanolamine-binding protein (PEBP) family uncharacterized protein